MAAADYYICSLCKNEKVYFDAGTDYDHPHFGQLVGICKSCSETHEIVIREKQKEEPIIKSCGNCSYRMLELHIEPCLSCHKCDSWEKYCRVGIEVSESIC